MADTPTPQQSPTLQGQQTDLRLYFQDTLFQQFAANRKSLIEGSWNNCRAAFRKLYQYNWKGENEGKGWRSKTYIGIVRQKVISMCALVADQYFKTGKFPYKLDADSVTKDQMQQMDKPTKEATESEIENFQRYMDEQLTHGGAISEYNKMLFDLGILGKGFQKKIRLEREDSEFENVSQDEATQVWQKKAVPETIPARERVSPWEMFWDLENGLRKGQAEIQRRLVSPFTLVGFKDKPLYINPEIDAVISSSNEDYIQKQSGVSNVKDPESINPAMREITHRMNNIEFLECWGRAPKQAVLTFEADLRARQLPVQDVFGNDVPEEQPDSTQPLSWQEVTVTIAKNRIIRYARSTNEERPYYDITPQEIPDEVAPDCVALATMPAEALVNGSLRGMEDNGKLSGNVGWGVKEEFVENMDELKAGLEPGFVLKVNGDCDDARKAMVPMVTPNVMSSYSPLLELGFKMADEESLIPKLSQGIEVAPKKTAYEVSTLIERASKFIGCIIRALDPFAEQHIKEIYEYNMEDPDCPAKKGNYRVIVRGYSSYQEEVLLGERLKQLLTLLLSDQSGKLALEYDIGEIVESIARSMNINVSDFHKSAQQIMQEDQARQEAEQQAQAQQAQQGQPVAAQPDAGKADLQAAQAEKARAESKKALSDANAKQRDTTTREAIAMAKITDSHKQPKLGKARSEIIGEKTPTDQILMGELNAGAPVQ